MGLLHYTASLLPDRIHPLIARTRQLQVTHEFVWCPTVTVSGTFIAGEDLFDEVGEIVPALPPKQGRLPAPGSRGSTPTLGSIAVPRPPSRRGAEVSCFSTVGLNIALDVHPIFLTSLRHGWQQLAPWRCSHRQFLTWRHRRRPQSSTTIA